MAGAAFIAIFVVVNDSYSTFIKSSCPRLFDEGYISSASAMRKSWLSLKRKLHAPLKMHTLPWLLLLSD